MLEDKRGPPTWLLPTRLCNFERNISTNISTLGQCTKLGEVSSLFIVYNITIVLLYPMHGFKFYFLFRDNAHTLYKLMRILTANKAPKRSKVRFPGLILSS